MNIGEAYAIFKQIDSEKFTTLQKLNAIKTVTFEADTINGITKDDLRNALRWVWDLLPGQAKWCISGFDLSNEQEFTIEQFISSPRPKKEKGCEYCNSFIPRTGICPSRCTNLLSGFNFTIPSLDCEHFRPTVTDHEK